MSYVSESPLHSAFQLLSQKCNPVPMVVPHTWSQSPGSPWPHYCGSTDTVKFTHLLPLIPVQCRHWRNFHIYLLSQCNDLVYFAVLECCSRRLNITLCLQSWTKSRILQQNLSSFSELYLSCMLVCLLFLTAVEIGFEPSSAEVLFTRRSRWLRNSA